MESNLILILFLSLGLSVISLLVMVERRRRRGLQALISRWLDHTYHKEAYHADGSGDADRHPGRQRRRLRE